MIQVTKRVEEGTEWILEGHARTDICNGISLLFITFIEELKTQAEDLEYEIERRGLEIDGAIGEKEVSYISYSGSPVSEGFFETGIRLMSETYPAEVSYRS